jgi:catechol 2,3-dioxygenase-like lactoylglutathione lyase family enzyme
MFVTQEGILERRQTMYPIDHINRYVSDVDEHVSFYEEVLAYELIGRGTKADGSAYAVLKGDRHELFVSERQGLDAGEQSLRHIGYSVDDVDGLLAKLKQAGRAGDGARIEVKECSRQLFLRDPDGNEVDIIQWTDKESFYAAERAGL